MPPKAARKSTAKAKAKGSKAFVPALQPLKPLFEQQDEIEAQGASNARKQRSRTVSEAVAKAIRDNFPMFRQGQSTMLMNKQGKTLVELLTADREKIEAGEAGAPVLGKLYYDRLKKDFTYSDSPAKQLKVARDQEELNEDLVTALMDINKHPRSFENAMDFLDHGPMLNQKSLVLLFKQGLHFNPHSSPDVVCLLIGILKCCALATKCMRRVLRSGSTSRITWMRHL